MLRKYPSTSPGQRHRLTLIKPRSPQRLLRQLQYYLPEHAGRNNRGIITCQGKGGGNKINYKIIDYQRKLWNIQGIVKQILYDPNRTSLIALIAYNNGLVSYQIAVNNLKKSQIIEIGPQANIAIGNSLPLINIPTGVYICLIATNNKGATLCRSAGSYAIIIRKNFNSGYAIISLNSGIFKAIPLFCIATIGQISNIDHHMQIIGKAGLNRMKGIRPSVRGVAKNPVDHPHGGGNGSRVLSTPSGKHTKGAKTRSRLPNIFHQLSAH